MEGKVFERSDGSQVLVMWWPDEPGVFQVAERDDKYDSWGPPLKEAK